MKTYVTIVLALLFCLFSGLNLEAQTTFKEAKKDLKGKAIKDARKEAKRWGKEGYTNMPGDPPLDKQFEVSMIKQYMMDEKGNPLFIVTQGTAMAGTEGVASANAMDNARLALAGQITSEVSSLISNNQANTQYSQEEVETIDEFISNSKTLIQQELGALKPAIRMFRKVGKNVEYRYSIVYSLETAKNITKKVIRKDLQDKLKDNEEDLDKLLGL